MVDFVCIGGKKCGTSWLYNQLSNNKNLNPSKIKEPNFFSNKKEIDLSWYTKLWNNKKKGLKFECSANYIYSEDAILKIKKLYPKCKFILIYRNHLSRSISHYNFINRKFKTKNEEMFLKDNYKKIIENSLIHPQLKKLEKFNVLSNTLLINFNDIIDDPINVINSISVFLNVELKYFKFVDQGTSYKPKSIFLEKIRNNVTEFFLHKLSLDPKNIFIFSIFNKLYKNLLINKSINNKKIESLIKLNYSDLFEEDVNLILKNFNLKM